MPGAASHNTNATCPKFGISRPSGVVVQLSSLNGRAGGERPENVGVCGSEVRVGVDGYVWCRASSDGHAHAGGVRRENVRDCVPSLRVRDCVHGARLDAAKCLAPLMHRPLAAAL